MKLCVSALSRGSLCITPSHHWWFFSPPRTELGTSVRPSVLNYTYFLIGQIHRPQHWAMSVRFFSASLMSLLMESIPSSIRSNCSVRNRGVWVAGGEGNILAAPPNADRMAIVCFYSEIRGLQLFKFSPKTAKKLEMSIMSIILNNI